ncbi:MAG: glycoside hydrolase family 15 protein [Clostridiales bacterium]|jgi:oligosaccharide amylase|nr:glycoside hydrolase family 15 protein [Eubacteriales bacterium]MDH7566272.1 glycoside hydrolase family 15 protein [Clostridiales bacterium]
MAKTYFNDAIIGNSSMLGCLTGKGELVRLFWPNIDYPQHVDRMNEGVFFTDRADGTLWLHDRNFQHIQRYIGDTNILETECTDRQRGVRVVQFDFVVPDGDVMIRRFEIENTGENEINLGFMHYSSWITASPDISGVLFDFENDALIHYRHGFYISISADVEVYQFQLGNNAFDGASRNELKGYDSIGMMQDGALSWKLGSLPPGGRTEFALEICASSTLKGVKELMRSMKGMDAKTLQDRTREYWCGFLKNLRQVHTGNEKIDSLYRRSLLVFKLMSDGKTGGLLAAPEIDEGFTRCGRYAYCWGRDAAFITGALDQCGLTDAVEKFYHWAVGVQDEDGSWHQRYHMDGNLAPSWGLQIDETGTLVWGMLEHYKVTGDMDFLKKVWDSVDRAVKFMIGFIDVETGLPGPSFDLWEERFGEHAYSSAAVCAGIKAGIEIGRLLGIPEDRMKNWELALDRIRNAIVENFWREDRKCFLRSIRTKLNPWGNEYTGNTTVIKVNPKGYTRDVTLEDGTVDISLLGLAVPFEIFDVEDCRMKSTVEAIERMLTVQKVGGIKRYENDNYIGGNPWVVATLWLALYYIRKKDYGKAKTYFDWAAGSATELGLLPEQISKDDARPAWVIPLTWSHAMFVLALMELSAVGAV